MFVRTVGAFGPGDLAVLDIEVTDNVGPSGVAQFAKNFVDEVCFF